MMPHCELCGAVFLFIWLYDSVSEMAPAAQCYSKCLSHSITQIKCKKIMIVVEKDERVYI